MNSHTRHTRNFIGAMAVAAVASAGYAAYGSHTLHLYQALAVLALAAATSQMKVKLPGIDGNMSVNLPFLLIAVVNLSAAEAVAIACLSTLVQCWPKQEQKFKPEQMVFNVSMMGFASSMASLMFHAGWMTNTSWAGNSLMLMLATATLFLGQTAPVAAIIALSDGGSMRTIWWSMVQLSFPYYVVGAGLASMMQTVSHQIGWPMTLAVLPVMYGIHRSYRMYFSRMVETLRTAPPLTMAARAGA